MIEISDPSKEVILHFLSNFKNKANLEQVIYWFAETHYGHKNSNLYKALTNSFHIPDKDEYGILPGTLEWKLFQALIKQFSKKFNKGVS